MYTYVHMYIYTLYTHTYTHTHTPVDLEADVIAGSINHLARLLGLSRTNSVTMRPITVSKETYYSFKRGTFVSTLGMNFCPPKPGFTDMRRMMSSLSMTYCTH